MKIEPIRPEEITGDRDFPWYVVKAFNDLISKDYRTHDGKARVYQDQVIALIISYGGDHEVDESSILKHKWLDIEDYYRHYGWKVVYNKRAYYDTGRAFWEFTKA